MIRSLGKIEVHGHRGCRGYLPENTIPAFLKAIEIGVDAIEIDVVITGDNQVLVSHEAWFSSEFCLNPDGSYISITDEPLQNIFNLPYNTIKRFDCGSKPHPRFPDQENMAVCKPLLADLISTVEAYTNENNLPTIKYNIEIKSYPEGDGLFHPSPTVFVDLLMAVLQAENIVDRTMIQSFDVRPLQEIYHRYGNPYLGLLVENEQSAEEHLSRLGFTPYAYNPHFSLLNEELMQYLKNNGISTYIWTVNTVETVQNCIDFQVNGIITDYPLLVRNIL